MSHHPGNCVVCEKEFDWGHVGYHGKGWSAHVSCFENKIGPMTEEEKKTYLKELEGDVNE